MPRKYRHIQEYEKDIMELRGQGKTGRENREKLGFSKKQYDNFITRYNCRQDKIAAGRAIKKKGRPAKDSVVTKEDGKKQFIILLGSSSQSTEGTPTES